MTKDLKGLKFRIKKNWYNAGDTGTCLGNPINIDGILWVPVLFDGSEDPDFHKSSGLEVQFKLWKPLLEIK